MDDFVYVYEEDPDKIWQRLYGYLNARRGALKDGPDDKFVQAYIMYWQIAYVNGWRVPDRAESFNYKVTWRPYVKKGYDHVDYRTLSKFEFTWAPTRKYKRR